MVLQVAKFLEFSFNEHKTVSFISAWSSAIVYMYSDLCMPNYAKFWRVWTSRRCRCGVQHSRHMSLNAIGPKCEYCSVSTVSSHHIFLHVMDFDRLLAMGLDTALEPPKCA